MTRLSCLLHHCYQFPQALRSKSFAEWASREPQKSLQARARATWQHACVILLLDASPCFAGGVSSMSFEHSLSMRRSAAPCCLQAIAQRKALAAWAAEAEAGANVSPGGTRFGPPLPL